MLTEGESYLINTMLRTLLQVPNKNYGRQLYQKLQYGLATQTAVRTSGTKATTTANAPATPPATTPPAKSSDNPQNLPPLPVPKLSDTIEKYLSSVKPFLDCSEWATTKEVFKKFSKEEGPKLQEFLEKKSKCTVNWFEPWWLEVAYLGFRQPVVVYSSPGQTLPLETFKCENERLQYAAKLIIAAGSYKLLIDSKKMPVEKMGKDELDMNQYNKIFGTCRIPCSPIDKIKFNPQSRHIVVVHNNEYFRMKLLSDNYELLSEKQVLNQLNDIILRSREPAIPFGILTTDNRDNWANSYGVLMSDCINQRSVNEIQTSLFLLCLDSPMEHKCEDNRRTSAGKQLIHGGGSCANSGNRWYDKTVQFVLGTDGIVGLTYEHSPSEGQPIAVMVDYLYNFMCVESF